VEILADLVIHRLRVDIREAMGLAEGAMSIAEEIGDKVSQARGLRAKANVLYLMGRNQEALALHEGARGLFEQVEAWEEVGRTLSASLQPMVLLGEHDRALQAAGRAREIFTRLGDQRRLARLEINAANILLRQDRFAEALESYRRAYEQLLPRGEVEGVAVSLHNMAVCQMLLNDFREALTTHQRAREYCTEHNMPLLAGQADYNIAWLHYQRGEYSKAIGMLREARETCEKNGDLHHVALCHLDLSDLYLELNLSSDAEEMAQEALQRSEQLGMGYEAAKAKANLAIAAGQQGKAFRAIELFVEARKMFVHEKNDVWASLLDLYQALLFFNEGRLFESKRLALAALNFFSSSQLPAKAILCRLLLGRLAMRTGDHQEAHRECQEALEILARTEAPLLHGQAHFLMSQVREAESDFDGAYESCREARASLEALRSSLRGEELKIAFVKNKLEVYESLVHLCLGRVCDSPEAALASRQEAFGYMEEAKSRSLRDLLFGQAHPAPPTAAEESSQSPLVRKIRNLRDELNWFYHRIETEQMAREQRSPERVEQLQAQARTHENELLRVLREAPREEAERQGLTAEATVDLGVIRAALGPDNALVEYFRVRDHLMAAVITADSLKILPLTPVSRVAGLLRLLQFQLGKFRMGGNYVRSFETALMAATHAHLYQLHHELVEPVRAEITARHIVFVPHDLLHYLPFHALFDGIDYLMDRYTISYAPSATVFAHCQSKPPCTAESSLVLGIPDAKAPAIPEEVAAVARELSPSTMYMGAEARQAVLSDIGSRSRVIHIATHGQFREDNPMFSGIRLGDGHLSLYDLYHLKLPADLITLSGCATGQNALAAGDELLGLVRGLLYAGAHSLLLTMWDVHDGSTTEFMKLFYSRLLQHRDKARALQEAAQSLRQSYPHPYYWAPFMLVGKFS
jgi:CHAT domain-containing protein